LTEVLKLRSENIIYLKIQKLVLFIQKAVTNEYSSNLYKYFTVGASDLAEQL